MPAQLRTGLTTPAEDNDAAPTARRHSLGPRNICVQVARVQGRSPTYTAPAVSPVLVGRRSRPRTCAPGLGWGRTAQTGLVWPSRAKRIRCSYSSSGGVEGRIPASAPGTAKGPRRTTDGSMISLPSQDGCGHHPRREQLASYHVSHGDPVHLRPEIVCLRPSLHDRASAAGSRGSCHRPVQGSRGRRGCSS